MRRTISFGLGLSSAASYLLCMKFAIDRPFADPEKAARRIVEIASTVEPAQDGRIHIELINGPFLFKGQG